MSNELSTKLNLALYAQLSNSIEIEEESPLKSLISNFSDEDKERLINLKTPENMRFFYINYISIHKYLYDKDETIEINSNNFRNNFINYFYLVLLIASDKDLVNYVYSIKIIQDLNNREIQANLNEIIIGKIIMELINNYKNSENYKEEQNNELDTIEQYNSERIKKVENELKKYDIIYNNEKLKNIDIDLIYIHLVINVLLKSGVMEEKSEKDIKIIEQFVEQFELENLELTKSMFEEISKYFNGKDSEKYEIRIPEDLYEEKNINFYYNLCKYILKRNYYIYHINFLFELKKKLIDYIRTKEINYAAIINNEKIDEEKFKFVIDFYTDSKYYYEKIFINETEYTKKYSDEDNISHSHYDSVFSVTDKERKQEPILSENKSKITAQTTSEYNSKLNLQNKNSSDLSLQRINTLDISDYDYSILTFQKFVMSGKSKTKEIIELSQGYYLKLDFDNTIRIYDKNFNEKNFYENESYIQTIKSLPDENIIRFVALKYDKFVYFEFDTKNAEISCENPEGEKQDPLSNQYFELNKEKSIDQRDYIISGKSGIYLKHRSEEEEDVVISSKKEENFNNAIKVTDKIYSFTSNEILIKGKNILKIYNKDRKKDNSNPTIIPKYGSQNNAYSFSIDNNGLSVVDLNENYKLLLCSCNKYLPSNKNGILIIKISSKSINNTFNSTNNFEAYCFCSIYENKKENYAYVLVGGLEIDKRRNNIKLYKVSIDDDNIKFEYLQDAVEDFNGFDKFDGKINKIIRPKGNDRYIIVSCTEYNNYLFSLPENDYYVEVYDEPY